MTLADSATTALAVTAVLAVVARLAGALTTGGALAGAVVGTCVSFGFGLPGLAVLGTFFVVGTIATRIGWKTKKARGTAEAGEGRRDWRRVLGKGGVAAAIAALQTTDAAPFGHRIYAVAFVGALAAALADTLGTEVGTLSDAEPRSIPALRRVPAGTPGAISLIGVAGAAAGAALVATVGWAALLQCDQAPFSVAGTLAAMGLLASLVESLAVGLGLRWPGFARNLLTTLAGAVLAHFNVHWLVL